MPLASLDAAPYNPRRISDEAMRGLRASVQRFGLVQDIVWNERTGRIVAGHQRRLAALDEGIERAEVIVVDLPEVEEKALNVALNSRAIQGEFTAALEAILDEIQDHDGDIYDDLLLAELRAQETVAAGDGADAEQSAERDPVTKRGDVWLMHGHRLICGDAQNSKTMAKLMKGEVAQVCNTDPPYGVDYADAAGRRIANDGKDERKLQALLTRALKLAVRHTANSAAFYIWHASRTRRVFEWAMDAAGLEELQYLTWVKESFVLGHAHYHWQTEPCFYAGKCGESVDWRGGRNQATVWRVIADTGKAPAIAVANGLRITAGDAELYIGPRPPRNKRIRRVRADPGTPVTIEGGSETSTAWHVGHERGRQSHHPNQKPIALAERALLNSSAPGQIALDPFAGAGFTIIAAARTERLARASELEPRWCDVICRRFLRETGDAPVRENDGAAWTDLTE